MHAYVGTHTRIEYLIKHSKNTLPRQFIQIKQSPKKYIIKQNTRCPNDYCNKND